MNSGFKTIRQDTKMAVLSSTAVHIDVVVKSQVQSIDLMTLSMARKRMIDMAQTLGRQPRPPLECQRTYKKPRANMMIISILWRNGSRIRATTGRGIMNTRKSEAMWAAMMPYIQLVS